MKDVAKTVTEILLELAEMVKPGTNMLDIERKARELVEKHNVKSYNYQYHPKWASIPYPAFTCINVDSVIAHGIPGDYELKEGEICGIDIGIVDQKGHCGDSGLTLPVGKIENKKSRLLYYAKQTLYEAIGMLEPGTNTEDIAKHIKKFANARGYTVNRIFAGHKIGKEMHEHPNIYNTPEETHTYGTVKVGEVYCIEPFLTPGKDDQGGLLPNGWTWATRDAQPSAFFEHMVKVTKNGPVILTDHIKDLTW